MCMQVTDVKQVLASVGRMCDGGNRVVFDDWSGSYIENKRTGERTPLVKKNGIYTFDLWTKGGGTNKGPDKRTGWG